MITALNVLKLISSVFFALISVGALINLSKDSSIIILLIVSVLLGFGIRLLINNKINKIKIENEEKIRIAVRKKEEEKE